MSAASASDGVTRQSLVDAALEAHPRLGQAQAQVDSARAQVRRTWSSYFPEINLAASAGVSDRRAQTEDGNVFGEQSNPTTASIELNQTLYASGQRSISSRLAQIALRRAEIQLDRVELELKVETLLAVEALQFAAEEYAINIETLSAITEQRAGAQARADSGAAARTDVAQAETRLAEARARLATSQANQQIAQAQLAALTGLDEITLVQDQELTLSFPPTLEAALTDALDVDLTLRDFELLERQARLESLLTDRRYGATVALIATAQRVNDPSPLLDQDDEARAVISLSLPLFSGGARAADRRAGLAQQDQVRFARLEYQQDLITQVRTQWALLRSAEAALVAQRTRQAAAREALVGVEEGVEAGLTSTLDTLDALRELQLAQSAQLNAQRQFVEAQIQFAALTGVFSD